MSLDDFLIRRCITQRRWHLDDFLIMFWTGHKANPVMTRGLSVHRPKSHCLRKTIVHLPHSDTPPSIRNCMCVPQRLPDEVPHYTETVVSHARLYKGDFASPSRYDLLSHASLHTPLISYTDMIVGVLTCLHAPFTPS